MAMPTKVQHFEHGDTGVPSLFTGVGTIIPFLDALLLNGFNQGSVTTLTQTAGVATLVRTGHGFRLYDVIEISGANEADYNGRFRLTEIIDNDTVKFEILITAPASATGTITCKKASLDWEKLTVSGTNVAAYRSKSVDGPRHVLVVDDNLTSTDWQAALYAYEKLQGPNLANAVGPYSISPERFIKKSNATSGQAFWDLIGDDKIFYFNTSGYVNPVFTHGRFSMYFGQYKPKGAGTLHSSCLTSHGTVGAANWSASNINNSNQAYAFKSVIETVPYVYFARDILESKYGGGGGISYLGPAGLYAPGYHSYTMSQVYPNKLTYGSDFSKIILVGEGVYRGSLPGAYCPLDHMSVHPTLTSTARSFRLDDVVGAPNGKLLICPAAIHNISVSCSVVAYDPIGPWEY